MVRASFLFSFLLLYTGLRLSAQFVQGPYTPSQISVLPQAGSSQSWRLTENGSASDDQWAITADSLLQGEYTDYLIASDFGFELPSNAVVYGIEVELECHRSSGNIQNFRSRLIKDGSLTSVDIIASGLWPRPHDDYYSHGGAADTWSEYWTSSDINDSTFGYAMAIDMTSNDGKNHTALIDDIRIYVYYDVALKTPPLLPIKAQWSKAGVALQWEGLELAPNGTISLERAFDGRNFNSIYQEQLPGDTLAWSQFHWLDSLPSYHQAVDISYRVCYEAPGQDKYYSSVSSLASPEASSLSMIILPAQAEQLNVRFTTYDSQSPVLLCVLNAEGRKLHEKTLSTNWGTSEHQLSTRNWSPGIYYFQLSQEGSMKTEKVVVR